MNKYITYLIYIIIAFATVVGGFLVYSFVKKNNENVPGHVLGIAEGLLTIPAPQLAFYAIIMIALISIVVYNIFKPKYGLPHDVFKFCYKKPFDTRTIYVFKNKQHYIPGEALPYNANLSSTYGIWLYISGVDSGIMKSKKGASWMNTIKLKKVLSRGILQDPKLGIYIKKDINDMIIKFNTTENDKPEQIILENIPLNRWFQIILTINENKNANLYLNGKLIKTYLLRGNLNIKQNMNIYVGDESGSDDKYPGLLFKAFYSSNALSSNTIRSIYNKQKHQVIKYYKKYLEPKIKKSNKPICKPKQNIFNNYKDLIASKNTFNSPSKDLNVSKKIFNSPNKALIASKKIFNSPSKDLIASKKTFNSYHKDLIAI
tara:strand:+ start:270 stop:1391 length:1122 start_codon:yes stop_codon:yes gene_type:complete